MAKKRITFIEYIFAFIGFVAMYFFLIPDSDVLFFTRDYEKSFSSIFGNALNYGNGRLLGNIIGFGVSQYFISAFLVVAVTLTLLVVLMNKFFFDGDYRSVMPLALAVAFPCSGFISEVYMQFPSFVNFVIPFVFVFAVLCLIKKGKADGKNAVKAFFILIFAVASCLFSENTTISIFVFSVLAAIYCIVRSKKLNVLNIAFVIGTAVGGLAMMLIPKVTGSAQNLDSYHEKADSIAAVITSALAAFSLFADILTRMFIPLTIISAALILLLVKESGAKKNIKNILIFLLAFFPIEAFFYSVFSQYGPPTTYFYLFQAGLVIVYAIALFISILCLKKSEFRTLNIGLYILVLSSFGPMLLAYLYGWRTFYLPYIVLLGYAIVMLKKIIEYIPKRKACEFKLNRILVYAASFAFLCLSFTVFIQSVYNYNFYVVRTQTIAERASTEESASKLCVPVLPCRGISCEDENPTLVESIKYKTDITTKFIVAESIYCKNAKGYDEVMNTNPVSAVINALQSLEYKDGRYIYDCLPK